MKIKMSGKWAAKKEGKTLCALFDANIADARHTRAADIDPVKDLKDEFKRFDKEAFRRNFKNTAKLWIAGKAMAGIRRPSRL